MERGLRNAAKRGLLASSVNPRLAAVGLHALVDGLIVNWVLDPTYLPLARDAQALVDQYLDCLRVIAPKPSARRTLPAIRRSRAEAGD
jgi:TetR/AcrR family acrAB operon transcriptional repressor